MNRLPKSAKRVFHGQVIDVFQWRQKMFDGSYDIFEAAVRPDTVEVIGITPEKKIVVLKQKQPNTSWFYCLPGGRVDKGESHSKAARREFLEETGFKAVKPILFKVLQPHSKLIYTISIFLARDCVRNGGLNLDCGEKIEVKLITFDKFLKLAENPLFMSTGYLRSILIRALYSAKHRAQLEKLFFK